MMDDFGLDLYGSVMEAADDPLSSLFDLTQQPSGLPPITPSVDDNRPYFDALGGDMYAAMVRHAQANQPYGPRLSELAPPGGAPASKMAQPGDMKYGPIDHSSRDAFLRTMAPYAVEAERLTGIPAEVMLAININEQGHATPAPGNNYFGIKQGTGWTGPTNVVDTWEVVNGQKVNIKDAFRAYGSPAESYRDFAEFLRKNSRYAEALKTLNRTGDPAEFIRQVHAAGYATDPNWSNQIIALFGEALPYVRQRRQQGG